MPDGSRVMPDGLSVDVACELVVQVIGGSLREQRFALLVVDCHGGCEVISKTPWSEKEMTAFLQARYEPGIDVARRISLARTQWTMSRAVPKPSKATK